MSGIGTSWYARNQSRGYPLAGYATAAADSGALLPEDIVVDIQLTFPADSSTPAYLQHVEVGETLSVVLACDGQAIATATTENTAASKWKAIALKPLVVGVSGHIVFGSSFTRGKWTFSSRQQSGISYRCATPVSLDTATQRLQFYGQEPLTTDKMYLTGTGDIVVRRSQLRLAANERLRDVVLVGIRDDIGSDALAAYAGPCGRRPESRTCGDPQPITHINEVSADCCGRIFIEIRGEVEMVPLASRASSDAELVPVGVTLLTGMSVDEACPSLDNTLPTKERGVLPGDDPIVDCEQPDGPMPRRITSPIPPQGSSW